MAENEKSVRESEAPDHDLDPLDALWEEIGHSLIEETEGQSAPRFGLAALEHLAAGRAIYYSDDDYPGETVKHYPDGHREIVKVDEAYQERIVRSIPRSMIDVQAELRRAQEEDWAFKARLDRVWEAAERRSSSKDRCRS